MPAKRAAFRPKTAREIAEKVGCSQSTVRRYWALPREEYLANSISRAKPWESLGMSRATWYRKGKPEPVQEPVQTIVRDSDSEGSTQSSDRKVR